MDIDHLAIWTADLERLRSFYERYFGARAGPLYRNPAKRFESYFLEFASGARLELMRRPEVQPDPPGTGARAGYAHVAFLAGTEAEVDRLTARLAADGHTVLDGPRRTGDGYYESVVADPDGNVVEITAG